MDAKKKFLTTWRGSADSTKLERLDRDITTKQAPQAPQPAPTLELAPAALVPFADADFWYLKEPLHWRSRSGEPLEVVVPKGFTTDFATVPSLFWTWIPPIGRHGYPAIVHDWLYWEQEVSRKEADLIFDRALRDLGVSYVKRFAMYQSVSWFGGSYWTDNKKAKSRGEKRILKHFPTDANISWKDWRLRADVFA